MKINVDEFERAVIRELGLMVKEQEKKVNAGLDKAAEILREAEERASPRESGEYESEWTVRKRGKTRFIKNSKMVQGKKGPIPLVNLQEYGPKSKSIGKVKQTFKAVMPKMVAAVKKEIGG